MPQGSPLPFTAPDSGLPHGLSRRQRGIGLAIIAVLCVLYVGFALTPSSYALAFDYLGLPAQEPLLGSARLIRSDEWMVYTPYVQIAVANDFGQVNAHSPYHEVLRTFQALPLRDWGLLFKPYHWAFMLLPAANAYSFFFLFMALAFVAGWALFLRQLRLPPLAAVLLSLTLFFSPFVQVWWTSNAGAFALAPWGAVAWLGIGNRWLRIAASAYALAVWLLAVAYPPFILSSVLAMGVLVLAFRRDALTLPRLVDAIVAGALALAVFVGYFHAIIGIVQNTVYPGRRESAGGGVSAISLLAHWLPNLMTYRYDPLPAFKPSNACEIAVFSSLLPLLTAVLADHRRLQQWARANTTTVSIFLAGTAFIACWIFLPVPLAVGKATGLYMVPPSRALLAFGLLLTIGCALALFHGGVRLDRARLWSVLALLLAGSLAKFAFGQGSVSRLHSAADAWPYLCLALLAFAATRPQLASRALTVVLAVACLGNLLATGLFNPVQSARPIFAVDRAAVLASLQQKQAAFTPDGVLVADGHYGALLPGIGIPAVNHVLYLPQLDYFHRHFPAMPDNDFDFTFNRFAHIAVSRTDAPVVDADVVRLPAATMLAGPPPAAPCAAAPCAARPQQD
ncbi:hypothetical protein [Stenotrophomonas sp. 24(2023)]|uniref:DUF7657 domain-containing protein n=1 Tax=Stenotrophomonas sp. 24(2023) TaxID=3068324 RepID=UPI0027E091F7|nr:hypothetical protein [Stenotrophomonas sp. 24(2023)]WMJ67861.1 hypothetical protein Q9R17_11585 [Stenotrophomonas sp. 24(2023)]